MASRLPATQRRRGAPKVPPRPVILGVQRRRTPIVVEGLPPLALLLVQESQIVQRSRPRRIDLGGLLVAFKRFLPSSLPFETIGLLHQLSSLVASPHGDSRVS